MKCLALNNKNNNNRSNTTYASGPKKDGKEKKSKKDYGSYQDTTRCHYQDATGNKKMAKLAEPHSDIKEGSPLEPFTVWELAPKLLGTMHYV